MEITSVNNELVKNYVRLQQKKYRTETGKFILEGYKAIKEAYDCGIKIEKLFVKKELVSDYQFVKNDIIVETNDIVLKKLSTTESAPPSVGIAIQKKWDIGAFKNLNKVILLESIKDAGNLGTIIRSAAAFGCEGIILFGNCTDIYNPKCVRSSVGNLWKIPIIQVEEITTLKTAFKNFTKISTLPRTNNLLKNYKVNLPAIVMFGSEAEGLSDEIISVCEESVKIEMAENVESLNLATSASIIMYELFGQK